MSEARNDFGRKSITPKTKKLHPRVDLTAMVSVSFLLIVFFMLTSFLSRSNAMDLGMPDKVDENENNGIWCGMMSDDRDLTIVLDKNKIVTYFGNIYSPLEDPKEYSYDSDELTKKLIHLNQFLQNKYGDPKKGLIVLIKPSNQSTYGNLVNVLDRLAIARTPTYAVVDINHEELELLKSF